MSFFTIINQFLNGSRLFAGTNNGGDVTVTVSGAEGITSTTTNGVTGHRIGDSGIFETVTFTLSRPVSAIRIRATALSSGETFWLDVNGTRLILDPDVHIVATEGVSKLNPTGDGGLRAASFPENEASGIATLLIMMPEGMGGITSFAITHDGRNSGGVFEIAMDTDPYPPVCFAEGTLIRTTRGDVPVEALEVGDCVLSPGGEGARILWIGTGSMDIPDKPSGEHEKWLPVRIPAHAFGAGRPFRDLHVSQQHRVLLDGLTVAILTGESHALAAAKYLVGGAVQIDRQVRRIRYFHILCEQHMIVLANGLPCESLYPGDMALGALGEAARAGIVAACPALGTPEGRERYMIAAPVLRAHEARLLRPEVVSAGTDAKPRKRKRLLRRRKPQAEAATVSQLAS